MPQPGYTACDSGHTVGGYWYDENGVWREITANDRCMNCHGSGLPEAPGMLYVPQGIPPVDGYDTYDTKYSKLDKKYCRSCHGANLADRHHYFINPCENPPAPPVIDTNDCQGMSPIVGVKMAHVTLTGTNFGNGEQSPLKCGDYKVQMEGGYPPGWVDLHDITWTDTLIEWVFPSWMFTPNQYHNLKVVTPTGESNMRSFYVLNVPQVDRIEDDIGVWLTVYGQLGTFTDTREKWYEDTLGGICPNFFGSIYIVTFTSENDRFCATIYDEWNATGNKDSFKVKLQDLWIDSDGDYFKDDNEQLC